MRALSPDLPVAATRPLGAVPAAGSSATDVTEAMSGFAWAELADTVATSGDRGVVAAAVAAAARHLGVREPADDTPLVVLQRTYGRLHRAAVTGR